MAVSTILTIKLDPAISMLACRGLVVVAFLAVLPGYGDDASMERSSYLPEPVSDEVFSPIRAQSPFRRSIDLSDSIVLTGVARIENDVFATLLDTATTESHVVSKKANPEGWQLVGVKGDESDLETLTAKIQVAGGEVVSIRYAKVQYKRPKVRTSGGVRVVGSMRLSQKQMGEAKHAAVNYREGFSSDGYPRQPPPEIVSKLSRMSVQQRETINRQMIELRNRGLGMDERRRIYVDAVNKTLGDRR